MAVQTWVARFVVDHGQVTEEGRRLRTFQRRHLDEPDVDLHVLVEPEGPNADELGAQALDAIGRLFVRDNLSLTGGLVRALQSTHQTLLDWNRRSVAREQVGLGLAAVVVRGATVYLAQVGPSLVFVKVAAVLERLPTEPEAADPLGTGVIEPVVRRLDLAPGDLVLGASLALESRIDADTLAVLLARGSEEALPELYLLTRDLPSFALFAVTCFETAEDADRGSELGAAPPDGGDSDGPVTEPALTFGTQVEKQPPGAPSPLLVAPVPLDISRPVVQLRRDPINSRNEYGRTTSPSSGFRLDLQLPRFFALGVAAAVIVFLVYAIVPELVRQDRRGKVSALVVNAQSELAAFQSEADPDRQRLMLIDVKRQAGEALRLDPANAAATALYGQAGAALQAADAVVPITPVTLATLSRQVTGDVLVDRVVVAPGTAYLLDSRGRRVFVLPLNGGGPPQPVYDEGSSYGGASARTPVAIAWDDKEGRLLILDSERKLFEVRPAGAPQPLTVRRAGSWTSVAGIAAYDGNLYVLDFRGRQVDKYLPAAAGFDSEPAQMLSGSPAISSGNAIAVNADIYVLGGDGKVHRFVGGAETRFPLSGIDRPLMSPRSIVALAARGEVYVADTGNKRVVVAGSDGTFRRQLVSSSFSDLRAIALDQSGSTLYAVAGDALLSVALTGN